MIVNLDKKDANVTVKSNNTRFKNLNIVQKFTNWGGYEENTIYDFPILVIDGSRFCFLSLPTTYTGEVYWWDNNESIIISDDYYELCDILPCLTDDIKAQESFKGPTSLLPDESTWFVEIKKCVPRMCYQLHDGRFIGQEFHFPEGKGFYRWKEEMNYYKERLEKTILLQARGKCGILLSGGVDSRLIMMILLDNNIKFDAYTMLYRNPMLDSNVYDVEKAKQLCRELSVPLHVVECDINNYPVEELDKVIDLMPSTSHFSLGYISLLKEVGKDNIEILFTGQNADTLHCFGATDRFTFDYHGFSGILKRLCLTKGYFKTLSDVYKNSIIYRFVYAIPDWIGRRANERKWNCKLYSPKTSKELVSNFKASVSSYSVYGKEKRRYKNSDTKRYVRDVYKELLLYKIHGFTKGGDAEAIRVSALEFSGCKIVFPYSSEDLLEYFAKHQLKLRDVFNPKNTSYVFIKEYAKKYGNIVSDFNFDQSGCDYEEIIYSTNEWYEKIKDSLIFKHMERSVEGYDNWGYLQYLSEYWKYRIKSITLKLESPGCDRQKRRN